MRDGGALAEFNEGRRSVRGRGCASHFAGERGLPGTATANACARLLSPSLLLRAFPIPAVGASDRKFFPFFFTLSARRPSSEKPLKTRLLSLALAHAHALDLDLDLHLLRSPLPPAYTFNTTTTTTFNTSKWVDSTDQARVSGVSGFTEGTGGSVRRLNIAHHIACKPKPPGIAGSSLPYKRSAPKWLKVN